MAPKPQNRKPGTPANLFKPDVINSYTVTSESPLMDFLMQNVPGIKRTSAKSLLRYDQVAVNNVPVRQFDHPLQPGDTVKVNHTRPFRVFYHRRMKLVYEDDDIIVVNKGYGLLSVSSDRVTEGTAYSILREYVKWSNPANKIFVVHRLDRDTSGLMMFAKSVEAKEAMQHNWNNMVLNRRYLAVVEGCPEPAQGVVKSYLAETTQHEVFSTDDPTKGKFAVTRYDTIAAGHGYALLGVELDTGRKNQIRVHMKDLGHPIAGDRRYGASSSPIKRLALHAQTLRFIHPITRKEMNFTTPVPSRFLGMVK